MEILLILIYLLVWTRIFVLSVTFRSAFRQAPSLTQRVPEALLGVKLQGRETDHRVSSSTTVTNVWRYTVFPSSLHYLDIEDSGRQIRFSATNCRPAKEIGLQVSSVKLTEEQYNFVKYFPHSKIRNYKPII
jgi:hypothetical protein